MLSDDIVNWMQKKVEERGADGALVGLSGGVDSALVAGLIKKAFADETMGVLLPCRGSHGKDNEYARLTADTFNLETITADLKPVYDSYMEVFSELDLASVEKNYWPQTRVPTGDVENQAEHNMKPRLRMVALYYIAEKLNYVVMGTSNKSEIVTGYYTNHGDNATDLRPLGDLTKTEVWQLAREIGVPEQIIERPPTGGLRGTEGDEDEIGINYGELDQIYKALNNGGDIEQFASDKVERVKELINGASSKEKIPVFMK